MPIRKRHIAGGPREARHLPVEFGIPGRQGPRLDIVLKGDSKGSVEAISALLSRMKVPEAEIRVIHSGVGAISKQDVLMAMTGSKLIVGFSVGMAPKLERWVKEHGVEVRLYDVIYRLAEDLKEIASELLPAEPEEKITAKCEIIAKFKSTKGGVILGCEVVEGAVQVGKAFRIVSAMGPIYSSRIESLQIEKNKVREARSGQQVGVKISDFTDGKVGDFIECYEVSTPKKTTWSPKGDIIHLTLS